MSNSTLIGGAALAWPFAARAQQPTLIGFLSARSAEDSVVNVKAFRQGLNDAGYVEGQNVVIQYRWAEGQYDRLPGLAADLISQQPALIVTAGAEAPAFAAKAATTSIPIIFLINGDPVKLGLVAQFNRPGGNLTGITMGGAVLVPKRLELLRELVPQATKFAVLVNPRGPTADQDVDAAQSAAQTLGIRLQVLAAPMGSELDPTFASFAKQGGAAVSVLPDGSWGPRVDRLVGSAARNMVPTIYPARSGFMEAGGLISYGTDQIARYREAGQYAGRVLKGAKPSELPVLQPSRFELVINIKTAEALGLTIPQSILARANEVIE